MLEIGEVKRGREIGIAGFHSYIWQACSDCGRERWVILRNGEPFSHMCRACATKIASRTHLGKMGQEATVWKGGRITKVSGYIKVKIYPDNPYFLMVDAEGYMLEHRLVMATHLGYPLSPNDDVHHKNGIKSDNRIGNLELLSHTAHVKLHNNFIH